MTRLASPRCWPPPAPQTSVEDNLHNALAHWTNWVAAGRPQGKEEILKIMGRSVQSTKGGKSVLGAWFKNTVRALTAEDPSSLVISGPKVSSFIQRQRHRLGNRPGYLAMSTRVRQAAKRLTQLTGDTLDSCRGAGDHLALDEDPVRAADGRARRQAAPR